MKAKDIIKILEQNPEFEVRINILTQTPPTINLDTHVITGLTDVGYSSKVIILDSESI
jgi:hypothetical protein